MISFLFYFFVALGLLQTNLHFFKSSWALKIRNIAVRFTFVRQILSCLEHLKVTF